MHNVLFPLISSLCSSLKSRAALQVEKFALRHQIAVLQQASSKRARLRPMDWIFWVWLSWLWSDWRSSIEIVKPETVIAWHRKGFRLYWRWKSRRPGRPNTKHEIGDLIRCLRAFFKTEGLEDGDTINQYALTQPTNENTTLLEMQ